MIKIGDTFTLENKYFKIEEIMYELSEVYTSDKDLQYKDRLEKLIFIKISNEKGNIINTIFDLEINNVIKGLEGNVLHYIKEHPNIELTPGDFSYSYNILEYNKNDSNYVLITLTDPNNLINYIFVDIISGEDVTEELEYDYEFDSEDNYEEFETYFYNSENKDDCEYTIYGYFENEFQLRAALIEEINEKRYKNENFLLYIN